jgi:hypothetical protein
LVEEFSLIFFIFCIFLGLGEGGKREMGIMVRERALQQAGLMEVGKRGGGFGVELEPEPQLPSGWEKCLDMKVGI